MSKKRKIFVIIMAVITALTLGFILINSIIPPKKSAQSSAGLYESFKPVFDFIFGVDKFTHTHFRQTAHFVEYFVLGIEVALLYIGAFDMKKQSLFSMFSAGLYVSVLDESLQIISGRGPEVVDVLTDYAGYLLAVVCCFLIFYLIKYRKRKN